MTLECFPKCDKSVLLHVVMAKLGEQLTNVVGAAGLLPCRLESCITVVYFQLGSALSPTPPHRGVTL